MLVEIKEATSDKMAPLVRDSGSNTINNSISDYNYKNLTVDEKRIRVSKFLHDQPDATTGEIAAACDLDYQECKDLLDKLEYEGCIRIILRRHYFIFDKAAQRRYNDL
jgi:hypothetical protein